MEKIGTKEMVQEISKRMGCYHKDVREVLEHFTNIMVENVCEGRKVQFIPLGVFSPKEIRHRDKNNVNDIKDIKIKFKQSLTITRKLANGSTGAEHAEIEETEDQQVS
jgi:DNA-binding protein HU-beta